MGKVVPIKTYSDRAEANFAVSILKVHKIRSFVSADDAGGLYPHLLWGTGGARLMVKEEDAEAALHILDDKKEDI